MISQSVCNSNILWIDEGFIPNVTIYFLGGGSYSLYPEGNGGPARRDMVPGPIAWAVLSWLVTSSLGPSLGLTWGHCSFRMALLRPRTTPGLFCGLIVLSHHCQRNLINTQLSLPLPQIPRWLPRTDRIRHSLPPSIPRPPQHGTNLPSSSSSSLSGLCSADPVLSHLHTFAHASSPSQNALAVPVTILLVPH